MFSILKFRQGCLYFYFYSSVWVSSVLQRGLILGALEGVTTTRQPGRWCWKETSHNFPSPFPNMFLFWMTCFYFTCCLLDPSKKEGSSSFLHAWMLPPCHSQFYKPPLHPMAISLFPGLQPMEIHWICLLNCDFNVAFPCLQSFLVLVFHVSGA